MFNSTEQHHPNLSVYQMKRSIRTKRSVGENNSDLEFELEQDNMKERPRLTHQIIKGSHNIPEKSSEHHNSIHFSQSKNTQNTLLFDFDSVIEQQNKKI